MMKVAQDNNLQALSGYMGVLSWRIYVLSIAMSFFVVVEPAPSDLIFVVSLFILGFSRPKTAPFLGGTAITGILLYLLFSVFSMIFVQINQIGAIRAVLIEFYMIGLFVMTAYFAKHRGDRGFVVILIAYTVGGLLATAVTIVGLLDLIPNSDILFRGEGARNRVKATFKDPNVFGPFLVPSLLFCLWATLDARRFRLLGVVVFALLTLSLIATFSRGAWVHAFITFVGFGAALLCNRQTVWPLVTMIIWMLILICVVVLLFLDQLTARLSDTFFLQRLSFQSYDDNRFGNVADAARLVLEHPLGIGPVQARFVYGYLPHNTFVAFAIHNGIFACLGLILIYLSAMVRCGSKVLSQKPGWMKYAFILSVLLGLLVLMQVVGAIHWRHMYVICGLAFGTYTTDRLLPEGLWRHGVVR